MRVSIKTILGKEVGSIYEEDFAEEFPHLFEQDHDEEIKLCSSIKGHVHIMKANHAFLVHLTQLEYTLEVVCNRCSRPFPYVVQNGATSVREFYVKKPEEYVGEMDEDYFRVDMTYRALDVDELLRQEIIVALPYMHMCEKSDCHAPEEPISVLEEGKIQPFKNLF